VARITRIMTWKLHMGVSLGIVGKNTQQGVEVHTHKTVLVGVLGRGTSTARL